MVINLLLLNGILLNRLGSGFLGLESDLACHLLRCYPRIFMCCNPSILPKNLLHCILSSLSGCLLNNLLDCLQINLLSSRLANFVLVNHDVSTLSYNLTRSSSGWNPDAVRMGGDSYVRRYLKKDKMVRLHSEPETLTINGLMLDIMVVFSSKRIFPLPKNQYKPLQTDFDYSTSYTASWVRKGFINPL